MKGFIPVGMGELIFSNEENLACYALGSCVASVFYARRKRLGGVAHVVLPGPAPNGDITSNRYATNAVDSLIQGMEERGVSMGECEIFLVGGAQVLNLAPLFDGQHIGERNIAAVKTQLAKHGLLRYRNALGGKHGRTMRLDLDSGRITVSRAGQEDTVL